MVGLVGHLRTRSAEEEGREELVRVGSLDGKVLMGVEGGGRVKEE